MKRAREREPDNVSAQRVAIDVGGTNLRIGVFENLNLVEEMRIQADFSTICKNNPPEKAWETIVK